MTQLLLGPSDVFLGRRGFSSPALPDVAES